MRFITYSNRAMDDDNDRSIRRQPQMLRESAARFGVPVENICPIGAKHDWTGQFLRRLVLEYLEDIPNEEIVLYTDAWDSFFAGTPGEMEAAFRVIGSPVVISPECNLWPPDTAPLMHHPPAPTRWRYCCGGGWAGYAGALRAMYTAPDFWPAPLVCNQAAFDDWVCRHPESAVVDYWTRLFVCRFDCGESAPPIGKVLEMRNGRPYNRDTDTYPLVWHGGGGTAMEVLELWKALKRSKGW